MHFDDGVLPAEYYKYIGKKIIFITIALICLVLLFVIGISVGAVQIPFIDVVKSLAGMTVSKRFDIIIFNIRLPQVLTAIVAGAGLAVSGAVMQSVLRNPLGSPFTLGISHAAAFGAAFSVMILGSGTMASSISDAVAISNPYLTTFSAFIFSMIAALIILAVSKLRQGSPEVMILTGVALGSLFTAGTMLLQFFADDVQLAAMVFWTFGDVARTGWSEIFFLSFVTLFSMGFFFMNAWNYNAADAGDETAKGVGVKIERTRLLGMIIASFVTSVIISFVGIIGFVGLVAPHMVRRIIGDDHRFLLPGTIISGSLLLLASDIVARLILSPHILPVSVLTSFLGAPVFIYLIIRGKRR
ncbi:MAG: iron ABC transporter permease [Desulfobacterales bacterium]|nr:iron ABC transporter permease [Desulfobacterales bacterium]